jgi:hypothetical protein
MKQIIILLSLLFIVDSYAAAENVICRQGNTLIKMTDTGRMLKTNPPIPLWKVETKVNKKLVDTRTMMFSEETKEISANPHIEEVNITLNKYGHRTGKNSQIRVRFSYFADIMSPTTTATAHGQGVLFSFGPNNANNYYSNLGCSVFRK